ncbi:probable glutamate receptor [Diachasmimorpha longicaudata]|uniref:probable glutamate receptor n=1 Tax=Diachasmimorpha longicaudata TaxID=58733 RepID=UPI0030B9101B
MKLPIHLILLATSSLVFVDFTEAIHHELFIKDVHNKYKPEKMWIILGPDNLLLEKAAIWHGVMKMLSHEGTSTRIVDFDEGNVFFKTIGSKDTHTLIVLVLNTLEEVKYFESMTTKISSKYAIWLIIFESNGSQDICEFCRKPYGSLSNPKFGLEVITLCCESSVIMKWQYSRTNRTQRLEVGKIRDENHRIVWSADELNRNQKYSMHGQPVRIVAVKASQTLWEVNGKYRGPIGELLSELSQAMNFTIPEIMWEQNYGVLDENNQNWTGAIGRIARAEADIGINGFFMTPQRYRSVSFTSPISFVSLHLYVRNQNVGGSIWNASFKTLTVDVWIVIVGIIVITPLLLTIIVYRRKDYFFPLLFEHYSYIWGLYCQQGVPVSPERIPVRIVYLSILISAMITLGAYSGTMISILAVSSDFELNSMEAIVKDGSYKLITMDPYLVTDMYKFSDEKINQKFLSLLKPQHLQPRTPLEAFNQVCTEKAAYLTSEWQRRIILNKIQCKISLINTGIKPTAAMITPLESKLLAPLNYHLERLKHQGLIGRLERKYLVPLELKKPSHPPVTVEGILPILIIIPLGLLIAIIIFLIERNIHLFRTLLSQKKRKGVVEKGKVRGIPPYNYMP